MKHWLTSLVLIFNVLPYLGAQSPYSISNYHVKMDIQENGAIHIQELIDVDFREKRRGIIREIPFKGNINNHLQTLEFSNIEVVGDPFKAYSEKGQQKIRIGKSDKFITGKKSYDIRYTAINGILNLEEYDELYWNVIGDKWDCEIRNASFEINLPKNAELTQDDLIVFSGTYGKNSQYGKIEKTGPQKIEGQSLVTLGKGKALSVGVKLPNEFFNWGAPAKAQAKNKTAATEETSKDMWSFNKGVFAPLAILLGFVGFFFRNGRNRRQYPPAERYYPPEDMTAAEVGTFFDFKANDRDLMSVIPSWGAKNIVKVKAIDIEGRTDIYLEMQNELPPNAPVYEKALFDKLFASSSVVFIDDLKYVFFQDFQMAKKTLSDSIDPGLYDETSMKFFHSNITIFVGALCVLAGILLAAVLGQLWTGIATSVLGAVIIGISSMEPKFSERGRILHNQLNELFHTLTHPDPAKLAAIDQKDPKYLEKVFPFVVAFGIENKFQENFNALTSQPPEWFYYHDGRTSTYSDFGRDFRINEMQKAMVTPPIVDSSSSSFGGSSDGGFSGGGFGGGGGSSW